MALLLLSRAERRVATAAFVAIATALFAGQGCELVVSDTVPPFSCIAGPQTCPSGQTCAPATGRCIPNGSACQPGHCADPSMACDPGTLVCVPVTSGSPADGASPGYDATVADAVAVVDATIDASVEADAGDAPGEADVNTVDVTPCKGLGCKCNTASDCSVAGSLCVTDKLTASADVLNAAVGDGGSGGFCTKPCCTSTDAECDANTVCFATGAGGNYCVPPSWLPTRSAVLGTKVGGDLCTSNTDCRSGLCIGTTSACADTCCSTSIAPAECAAGAVCRFGNFQGSGFDTHFTARCSAASGTALSGSTCPRSASCRSGLCIAEAMGPTTCHDPCRSSAGCLPQGPQAMPQACNYVSVSSSGATDLVASCVSASSGGAGAQGNRCTVATDCASGFCDATSQRCTDVCFTNTDCTFTGWRCRPASLSLGGAAYSVLACGT